MTSRFFADPESVLGTLARLFAADGAAKEVAVLTYASPELIENHYDSWNGGTTYYTLLLHVPLNLYPQIEASIEEPHNQTAFACTAHGAGQHRGYANDYQRKAGQPVNSISWLLISFCLIIEPR